MEQTLLKTGMQSVRFHDTVVQIETIILNGIECLCFNDVQRRFPSVVALCVDNIQLGFLRDSNGDQLLPLRIEARKHVIIEAVEPVTIKKVNDVTCTMFDQIDTKIEEINKKTDLIVANTQETLVRLKHVMTQMYELHEYTTPRYFFILPVKHHNWASINSVQKMFRFHYKLYFLCECSNQPDKLHVAPHDGYSIKKPSDFISSYGPYLRTTLNLARSILSIGGVVIPQSENVSTMVAGALPTFIKEPNNYNDVHNKLDLIEAMLNRNDEDLSHVDSSIIQKSVLPETPLQGAQLRELEAFLELVDNKHSLGNLYRTTTNDGHVRWVCLEHYNTVRFNSKMSEYIHRLESIGGKFNHERKEITLSGTLTTKNITWFCDALAKGFVILSIAFQSCSFDTNDLDKLFDVIVNRSSVQQLTMNNVEVRKWMKISKYICKFMTIDFKNQSLTVKFSNIHQNDNTMMLAQLLQQNKIYKALHLFGYDSTVNDQDLLCCLLENKQLNMLVINYYMNIEFLNEIITSNCSLTRIKLSSYFNASSTMFGLCQALGQNDTLIDLDLLDHTCVDDKTATIELLNVLQKHKSIKHVRLHVFDVQSSNEKETCLINSLLNYSLISHLRISESTISKQFIEALVHASKVRHALTYLEFYNSHLSQDGIAALNVLYDDENLTHLFISEQSYFSIAIPKLREQLLNDRTHYHNDILEEKLAQSNVHASISLDRMGLVDQDMKIIVKKAIVNKQCPLISLQFNKITSVGISILSDGLLNNINNNRLEALYLGDNYIFDDGVYFLANMLSYHHSTLKILVLHKNHITNRGVKYIVQMLKVNQTLLWLHLDQNEISDDGIRMLAQVLGHENRTLEMLVLSSNKLLTDLSIDCIIQMLENNQSLKKLWIDDCNFSESAKQKLLNIQKAKSGFYLRL